ETSFQEEANELNQKHYEEKYIEKFGKPIKCKLRNLDKKCVSS
ncbi:unnamed protein product, partial [marine sediment metagenome]